MKKKRVNERLQYQLKFVVDPSLYRTDKERRGAIVRARQMFALSGRSIHGVKIEARWRNPDNPNPRHANWKSTTDRDQSLYGFWLTIAKKVM